MIFNPVVLCKIVGTPFMTAFGPEVKGESMLSRGFFNLSEPDWSATLSSITNLPFHFAAVRRIVMRRTNLPRRIEAEERRRTARLLVSCYGKNVRHFPHFRSNYTFGGWNLTPALTDPPARFIKIVFCSVVWLSSVFFPIVIFSKNHSITKNFALLCKSSLSRNECLSDGVREGMK